MKKAIFLLVSILAISSALCFTGCNEKGDGSENAKNGRTETVSDTDGEETYPHEDGGRGMPKVRYEFKDGRPVCRDDEDGGVKHRHHRCGKHRRPPEKPEPVPPTDDGNENNGN